MAEKDKNYLPSVSKKKQKSFQRAKNICKRAVLPVVMATGCFAYYKMTGADLRAMAIFGGYVAAHSFVGGGLACRNEKDTLPYLLVGLAGLLFVITSIGVQQNDTQSHKKDVQDYARHMILTGSKQAKVRKRFYNRLQAKEQEVIGRAELIDLARAQEGTEIIELGQEGKRFIYKRAKTPDGFENWQKIAAGKLEQ